MGACDIGGSFISYDWKSGIERIQEEASYEYGYQEGYSGAANCVGFSYLGDYRGKLKTNKQIDRFIEDRLENHLYKRDGEVICVENAYVKVFTTQFTEHTGTENRMWRTYIGFSFTTHPATVCTLNNWGRVDTLFAGTISECKTFAHQYLRKNFYSPEVVIVCRRAKKLLQAYGKASQYKTTKRVTDDKHLVVPYYKFMYYGIAPE